MCPKLPPKKYEDIYPLNFDCEEWQSLWCEPNNIFDFWISLWCQHFPESDNPHRKPYAFWHWLIAEVKKEHPGATSWQKRCPAENHEVSRQGRVLDRYLLHLEAGEAGADGYFGELYKTDVANYLRPNLFANTPDILTQFFRHGGNRHS